MASDAENQSLRTRVGAVEILAKAASNKPAKLRSSKRTDFPLIKSFFSRSKGGSEILAIQEIIGKGIREFLITEISHENRFAFYRSMESLDPELLIARNYISLMIHRNFLGMALDTVDPSYMPSPDFLARVNSILAELKFTSKLFPLMKDFVRGNAFARIIRSDVDNHIKDVEILPADSITIVSEEFTTTKKKSILITEADYYIINEQKDVNREKYPIDPNRVEGPEVENDEILPEIILSPANMIHFAWDAEANACKDKLGRDTYNIWGKSPYDSIVVYVKAKLMIMTDYLRWVRMGIPRWTASVDMSLLSDLNQYTGTDDERVVLAERQGKELFDKIEESFYYLDQDEESPTFDKKLPVEPDAIFFHTSDLTFEQKGGANSPDVQILGITQECNRAIASAMGVPMSLLGYEEGSTYAIGRVTSRFTSGIGGGLLRSLEDTLITFLKREFTQRGWATSPKDWDNLYTDYERDDTEELMAVQAAETAKATAINSIATAARTCYEGSLLTKNESRALLRDGLSSLEGLPDVVGGDEFKPLQPLVSPSPNYFMPAVERSNQPLSGDVQPGQPGSEPDHPTLPKDQPSMEAGVKAGLLDSYTWFIEEVARKAEEGKLQPQSKG